MKKETKKVKFKLIYDNGMPEFSGTFFEIMNLSDNERMLIAEVHIIIDGKEYII